MEQRRISRSNAGWRANVGTLKDGTVEFQMVYDTADTDFDALQSAFLNNTTIEFLVLDGDVGTSGNEGLRATMIVSKFSIPQNLEEAMMVDVTIQPTYATNAPAWYTVP